MVENCSVENHILCENEIRDWAALAESTFSPHCVINCISPESKFAQKDKSPYSSLMDLGGRKPLWHKDFHVRFERLIVLQRRWARSFTNKRLEIWQYPQNSERNRPDFIATCTKNDTNFHFGRCVHRGKPSCKYEN